MGLDGKETEKNFTVVGNQYVVKEDPEEFVTIMKITNDKKETQIINSFSKNATEAFEKLVQAKQVYNAQGVNPEVIGTYKKVNLNVGYNIVGGCNV